MGRRLQSDSSESWMLASVFDPHCLLNTNCITWYPRYFCWRLEINFQLPGRGLDVGIIWWSIVTTLSGANGSHLDLWLWKKMWLPHMLFRPKRTQFTPENCRVDTDDIISFQTWREHLQETPSNLDVKKTWKNYPLVNVYSLLLKMGHRHSSLTY